MALLQGAAVLSPAAVYRLRSAGFRHLHGQAADEAPGCRGAGLPTPRYCVIQSEADLAEAGGEQLGLPIMVKPSDEGSPALA